MKPSERISDERIDALLRDVSLPVGLSQRLRELADESGAPVERATAEAEQREGEPAGDKLPRAAEHSRRRSSRRRGLRRRLRDVPLPPGLLDNLRAIPSTVEAGDEEHDFEDFIPSTSHHDAVARVLTKRRAWQMAQRRLAAAAAIAVLAITSLAAATRLFVPGFWRGPDVETPIAADDVGSEAFVVLEPLAVASAPTLSPPISAEIVVPGEPMLSDEALGGGSSGAAGLSGGSLAVAWPTLAGTSTWGSDLTSHYWGGVFGAEGGFDEALPWHILPGLVPRGIDPPASPDFDLWFLRRYEVHPFVSAAAIPETVVPLSIKPRSAEVARAAFEAREIPPPHLIRTEEFLAAMDYDLLPPTQHTLGIRAAAGPSPFAEAHSAVPLHLVQVSVQAATIDDAQREPSDLTLAIDISRSMSAARLAMVRSAVARLVERMQPHDRLSLVAFSDHAHVLLEQATKADQAAIQTALATLEPRNATNLGAALQAAYAVAAGGNPSAGRHVLLVTDGLTDLDPRSTQRIEGELAAAAADGIRLTVLDVAASPLDTAPWWQRLVDAGEGRFASPATVDEVYWEMAEELTGRSELVARDVELKVEFHSGQVVAYRLFGHEALGVEGLVDADPRADLHSGETATALFEIRLNDRGKGPVAKVHLSWVDVEAGRKWAITQPISRLQFAPSFSQSAPSLQSATVAAAAAEVLRHSYFAQSVAWNDVLQLAEDVNPRLREQPAYRSFLGLLSLGRDVELRRGRTIGRPRRDD
mgnify:CR=1 FL=1